MSEYRNLNSCDRGRLSNVNIALDISFNWFPYMRGQFGETHDLFKQITTLHLPFPDMTTKVIGKFKKRTNVKM